MSNYWFATLRGKRVGRQENLCGLYLATCSALYDELLDEDMYSHEQIMESTNYLLGEHTLKQTTLTESLRRMHENLLLKNEYEKYFSHIIKAQTESMVQLSGQDTSEDEIRRCSYEKGGYAMLTWRCAMSHPLVKGEEEAIYLMGVLLQLVDDIFDLYRDRESGEQTLVSTSTNLFAFQREYDDLIERTISLYKALDYPPENIRRMLFQMMTGLSRGAVALQQHLHLQGNELLPFDKNRYSRAELICNMERPGNLLKSLFSAEKWKGQILAP